MNDSIREKLLKLARKELPEDGGDFNPDECSGGNYDDCYRMGVEAGETYLARELLGAFTT